LLDGKPSTGYLRFGDTVRSEVKGRDGASVFGAVEFELVTVQRRVQAAAGAQGSSADTDPTQGAG
jgi:fumarylacetoacetate (FAA) hydrolase